MEKLNDKDIFFCLYQYDYEVSTHDSLSYT